MNKTIRLTLALAVVMIGVSSCKTKQKIAEIPAGANIEATTPKTTPKTTVTTPPVTYNDDKVVTNGDKAVTNEVKEPEVTRNENFSLVDGDKDALTYKYYVVVGSFTKQTNAKGLQTSLINEGNKAIIVINEKSMYRVLISAFNDYNLAHARIREISTRFPDAWVLVQK
jgi:cell division protein FtsN